MKRWWEKYQASVMQREQKALQKWSQTRLNGKAHFVLRNTLAISMLYVTLNEILGGGVGLGTIITWHAIGFVVGLYQWADNETKHQLARSNGQLNH